MFIIRFLQLYRLYLNLDSETELIVVLRESEVMVKQLRLLGMNIVFQVLYFGSETIEE